MSKCISREGEYGDHELAEQPRFMCARCFAFDEDAALSALDEAERERDKAIAEVARQQALRVENGKRFEQMRSERTAALARAEAAEAAIERVRALAFDHGKGAEDLPVVRDALKTALDCAPEPEHEEKP